MRYRVDDNVHLWSLFCSEKPDYGYIHNRDPLSEQMNQPYRIGE
ncbi:hypothetical protein [Peribacillus muralis]